MKTKILNILLIAVLFVAACTNSGSSTSNADQAVTSGTWRVTRIIDSGNDETTDFADYSFTYSTGGTVTAVKNSISKTGTWTVDNSSNKFIIDLGLKIDSNKPLGELTDYWRIVSTSDTEIRLTDDNPASDEHVTFTKN